MNCAFHAKNAAVVSCNGCGKPLCPACDHRIKGFPFCQDCIVSGIELLSNRDNASYVPIIKRQTSPLIAAILSLICPGLGSAYNGQAAKALVHFAAFIGLFQLAILTDGTAIFVLGFLGMWLYAAVDAVKTAKLIRSGITPTGAEDIIFQRLSGNPKLWGIVLAILGALFFLHMLMPARALLQFVLPVLLIGFGAYLLRDCFSKPKEKQPGWKSFENAVNVPTFAAPSRETSFRTGEFETDYETPPKNWKRQ